MKKLSVVLFALLVASFYLTTGCNDTKPKPQPTGTDTTDNDTTDVTPKLNGFKFGFTENYELEVDPDKTFAQYSVDKNKTQIDIEGTGEYNGEIVPIALTLICDTNTVGTYLRNSGGAAIALTKYTDGHNKYKQYSSEGGSEGTATITITEYGEVGGRIKGTFSGKVTDILTTYDIKNGYFDVARRNDN